MKALKVGKTYTHDVVCEYTAGGRSYIRTFGNEVKGFAISADMNPFAPDILTVGDKESVVKITNLLRQQIGVYPLFIKLGANRWIYKGLFRAKSFDSSLVAKKAYSGLRDPRSLYCIIFMERVNLRSIEYSQNTKKIKNLKKICSCLDRADFLRAIDSLRTGNSNYKVIYGPSTKFDLLHGSDRYPPIAVLATAISNVYGQDIPSKSIDGGESSVCFSVLREHNFLIVPKAINSMDEIDVYSMPLPNVICKPSEKLNENSSLVNSVKGKVDYEKLHSKNTKLGLKGEDYVIRYERERLKDIGLAEYVSKITHVSDESDIYGYDILSYDLIDDKVKEIYIEVKTTSSDNEKKPFYITQNQLNVSKDKGEQYRLYRILNFRLGASPSIYEVRGSLKESLSLLEQTYIASPYEEDRQKISKNL